MAPGRRTQVWGTFFCNSSKRKIPLAKDVKKKVRPGHNSPHDADKVQNVLDRVEKLNEDIETEKSAYMTACKVIRSDIKVVYRDAKNEGLPVKALKNIVKDRAAERAAERRRTDLDTDDLESYDQIKFMLGELAGTPLGDAALAAAA